MLRAGLRDDPASDSTHEFRVLVPMKDSPGESSSEGMQQCVLTDFSLLSAAATAAARASVVL